MQFRNVCSLKLSLFFDNMFFQNGNFPTTAAWNQRIQAWKNASCEPTVPMVGSVSSLKDGEVLGVQTPILGRPRDGSERINGFVVTHWEKWGVFFLGVK